jgi:hypothetical protein
MSEPNSLTETNTKFIVPIKLSDTATRLSDEVKNELKSIGMMDEKGKLKLKGVSPKIPCYVCKNFHSRISGQVYCRGEPL